MSSGHWSLQSLVHYLAAPPSLPRSTCPPGPQHRLRSCLNLLESSHLVQLTGPVNQLHHCKHLYKEVPLPDVATGCLPSSAGCFYLCGMLCLG